MLEQIIPFIILGIVYVSLCLLLALKGKEKMIDFDKTLVLSLILTPLVGMIFVMLSKRKFIKRVRDKDFDID
jgi:hypothetical protein